MMRDWKRWEGQWLNQAFVLGPFLGGSEHSAVFRTEYVESQPAVVKVIPADPDSAATMLSRLHLAAHLSHPNLIRLFDWGLCHEQNESLVYVVMEYAGENLAQVLPQRALTADETREILTSALDALAYLHREGFAHGRLKPANILAVDDRVKLSSDLLYPARSTSQAVPRPGPYSPPEAVRGEIVPAGDLWALASIMVEALTQRLPAAEADRVLPEPFLEIARHCLQADPRRRWPVSWVKTRLRAGELSLPVGAQPPAELKFRRYALSSAAAALVTGAILAGSGLAIRHALRESSNSVRVKAVPPPTVSSARAKPEIRQVIDQRPSPFGPRLAQPSVPAPPVSDADRASAPPDAAAPAVRPDQILHQVLPNVPEKALNTIQGKVIVGVAVQVDPTGNVVAANLESAGVSRYFADLALQAARGWKFAPAGPDSDGDRRVLRFDFRRTGTEVQVTP